MACSKVSFTFTFTFTPMTRTEMVFEMSVYSLLCPEYFINSSYNDKEYFNLMLAFLLK